MKRPIIIVDPRSSGVDLAPAFKARGVPVIAVTFQPVKSRIGFGARVQSSDFVQVIPDQPGLAEILRAYDPLAVIPGAEGGVALADALAAELAPTLANATEKSQARVHKAHMQQALRNAGVPSLATVNARSETEVEVWIEQNRFSRTPLIVKPPVSAGSDKVFHAPAGGDWRSAFRQILAEPSNITGQRNETVVVQEQAIGTEYAIGTVSARGRHYLSHLIKYNKRSAAGRNTLFDYVEFLPFDPVHHRELWDYAQKALDALGVKWGATHTEIMVTPNGPRLIETGARMLGGPTVGFSREATGSSQVEKLVQVYVDGDVRDKEYLFRKTVMPVFLKSPRAGTVENAEVFDGIAELQTLFKSFLWFENGQAVPQTVDYLTSIGIVALSGDREAALADYGKIRDMESRLLVKAK